MAKLSTEAIQSYHKKYLKVKEEREKALDGKSFGAFMNRTFNLQDEELAAETDDNTALLRLLRDHVQESE